MHIILSWALTNWGWTQKTEAMCFLNSLIVEKISQKMSDKAGGHFEVENFS